MGTREGHRPGAAGRTVDRLGVRPVEPAAAPREGRTHLATTACPAKEGGTAVRLDEPVRPSVATASAPRPPPRRRPHHSMSAAYNPVPAQVDLPAMERAVL